MRVAGIMSGTSLDGIDVAVVDISTNPRIRTVLSATIPYPQRVRDAVLAVSNAMTETAAISRLNFVLGELYARALQSACKHGGVPLETIQLVGCHGQTIFHEGAPARCLRFKVASTMQIGEAAVIAARTGIPVVSDFRVRDMAAGGRGAPLVPFVDYMLYRDRHVSRVALNIGGIANITALAAGARTEEIVAFDTGPGNMVVDQLAAQFTRGKQRFDRDGRIASRGKLSRQLLDGLLHDRYYSLRPPKSAGREQYGAEFVERLIATSLPLEDLVATATTLTATTIAAGIERFVRPKMSVDELIVSGGGVHNPQIMGQLAALLPGTRIATSADYGIDVDAKEAIAFAVLAYETWRKKPSNVPAATGAKHPVILGKLSY